MIMTQSSPTLLDWLSTVGTDQALKALAELLEDPAILIIGSDERILYWSHGAEKLLGFTSEQILGKSCHQIIADGSHRSHGGTAELGKISEELLQMQHSNGERIEVTRSAHAFFDHHGQLAGTIEMIQPTRAILSTLSTNFAENNLETFHGIITADSVMKQSLQIIRNVAETDVTVLIRGESGTGKELVARALHV